MRPAGGEQIDSEAGFGRCVVPLQRSLWFDLSTWRWDYTDPEWLTYENPDHRCAIQDGIDAVCKKAKNMRQIYIDITGVSLTILNEWKIGQDDGPGVIVNMSGGVVNVGTFMDLCGWSEWKYQD